MLAQNILIKFFIRMGLKAVQHCYYFLVFCFSITIDIQQSVRMNSRERLVRLRQNSQGKLVMRIFLKNTSSEYPNQFFYQDGSQGCYICFEMSALGIVFDFISNTLSQNKFNNSETHHEPKFFNFFLYKKKKSMYAGNRLY